MDQLHECLAADPPPTAYDITQGCGTPRTAGSARLRADAGTGADLDWISTWDDLTPLDTARRERWDALPSGCRRVGKSVTELR